MARIQQPRRMYMDTFLATGCIYLTHNHFGNRQVEATRAKTGILFLEHHGHLHCMVRPHECITCMNIFICLMIIKIVLTI